MANTNCLENRACPKCGQDTCIQITATSVWAMYDNGTDDFGDVEFGERSPASCPDCDFTGTWGDFSTEEKEPATVDWAVQVWETGWATIVDGFTTKYEAEEFEQEIARLRRDGNTGLRVVDLLNEED